MEKNISAESSKTKKSMWRPLSSQLQSVQALLPTQGVLRADFVGRLCGGDVNLGISGGGLSCQDTKTQPLHLRYHRKDSWPFWKICFCAFFLGVKKVNMNMISVVQQRMAPSEG